VSTVVRLYWAKALRRSMWRERAVLMEAGGSQYSAFLDDRNIYLPLASIDNAFPPHAYQVQAFTPSSHATVLSA